MGLQLTKFTFKNDQFEQKSLQGHFFCTIIIFNSSFNSKNKKGLFCVEGGEIYEFNLGF